MSTTKAFFPPEKSCILSTLCHSGSSSNSQSFLSKGSLGALAVPAGRRGLWGNGECKRPLGGSLCVCLCVRESEPDDGWSVLTCAAQWTVRLDMAGLSPSPSISFSHSLPHSFFASLPQGQTCHVATAHSLLPLYLFLCFSLPPPLPVSSRSPLLSDI